MGSEVCKQFCEVEHAARIIGVEAKKIEGWIEGGMLEGAFSKERWLAEIHDVCRRHARLAGEGRLCDKISEANRRMPTDMHTPRRAKTEKKLVELIDEISVVAAPGQLPAKTQRVKRCRMKQSSKTRLKEKKAAQQRNGFDPLSRTDQS